MEERSQVKFKWKQECIPVGCVPSAAVAVCPRWCLAGGGLSAQVHAGICLPRGVEAQCILGYVCPEGGCLPQCML